MEKPELRRDIEFVRAVVNGRQVIAVNDPLHLTEGQVILEAGVTSLLPLFDGTNDLRDVQVALMRSRGGQLVSLDEIRGVTERLDELFLLRSKRFLEALRTIRGEFAQERDRRPFHAGRSYDAHAENLAAFLEETECRLAPLSADNSSGQIVGIIAPHISIETARTTYVDLYRRLRGCPCELVIVLGINHQAASGLYSLSSKNYVTPFGMIPADREAVDAIAAGLATGTLTEDDFAHRTEHSLEFQAVFLHHYLPQSFSIVPILCNGIHELLADGRDIFHDERFLSMAEALKSMIFNSGKRALLVAGVDFAHIGMKFGHPASADALREGAERNDKKILTCLEQGDAKGIYDNALETQDRFNVCGLPALLLFSHVLKDHPGRLVDYGYYDERATKSAVTYAALVFSEGKAPLSNPPKQNKTRLPHVKKKACKR